MNSNQKIATLVAGAFVAALGVAAVAQAQTPAKPPSFQAEKCFGIAKAGANDCASAGNNSCGGTSRVAADGKAWMYVPAGTCNRMVGGSLTPKA